MLYRLDICIFIIVIAVDVVVIILIIIAHMLYDCNIDALCRIGIILKTYACMSFVHTCTLYPINLINNTDLLTCKQYKFEIIMMENKVYQMDSENIKENKVYQMDSENIKENKVYQMDSEHIKTKQFFSFYMISQLYCCTTI